eukprot:TRINITY_DN34353_c0_g1_i1.p1 TRINITY_DN34353_c0_g1~~TRINITY_DN34353_c0_g1_i1.p1  ORF type:complete len:1353 (-),score=369.93 TRINITY_DN34353_c0_g1_i1:172-4230(-)
MAPTPDMNATSSLGAAIEEPPLSTLVFFVNGKKVVDNNPDPGQTLLTYLRNNLRLCGTKLGCGEGGCGACTVMVSKFNRREGKVEHLSVNACLAPVAAMHGLAVTTVEGIGNAKGRLHAVQQRLANSHGSQCGFCTPGIVMSMYTLLRNKPLPSMEDVDIYFQGNLCRCTGYRPILEGFKTLTENWAVNFPQSDGTGCKMGENCCKNKPAKSQSEDENCATVLYNVSEFVPYNPSQEPIFPPELQLDPKLDNQYILFQSSRISWYRPVNLQQLYSLRDRHPGAKIVVGNTELGVEVKFKHCEYPVYINPSMVKELTQVVIEENGVKFGSSVTLSQLEETCDQLATTHPSWKLRIFHQIKEMLRWFAGKQIRNVAAIGGNIMTGSPISDLNPIFMASNCKLEIGSNKELKEVNFDEHFYTGYRRNIVKPHELLVSITVPFTKQNQYFIAYKQAKRRDDDIAIVNSAFNITVADNLIDDIKMAFGGMAPTTKLAVKSSKSLIGKQFDRNVVDFVCKELLEEFKLPADVPGSMVQYRQSLVISFFFKFFLTVDKELRGSIKNVEDSATDIFVKEPITSHQMYEVKADSTDNNIVGKPIKHKAAEKQVCGSAVYIDDMPRIEGELYLGLVLSSRAHAKILKVDASKALSEKGVEDWIDHTSVSQEGNKFQTAIIRDELVFAVDEVFCHGMVIGAIVAKDQETAQRAARMVQVEYQDLPAIVTMEEAIAANSYHDWPNNIIECGDVEAALSKAEHVVEGSMRTGAQEHFYLETQATIAIPHGEDDEITIWASTQNPTATQLTVASVLGIQANKVVVRVKRMGGGFGGKESRSVPISAVVAVAASKTGRPVRIMLDRDEDMMISGWRHPFLGKYKVAFDSNGMVQAADVDLYNNAGWTMDLSFSVMERAMFHSDNSYKVPNLRVKGNCCKTNLPSNTAFRGFGGPQGLMIVEAWIEKIAQKLNLEPEEVRRRNLYKEGMVTHFNQKLTNCTIEKCWVECEKLADFASLQKEVSEFNSCNRWKKRGVAMVPVKFGIAFTAVHLNQNGALINVYTDGSVLLTHGGTEMGQGLHTKMIQVASTTLGIDHNKIHIMETSTDKVPNTPPTAASAGSDLNGMAVLDACTTINTRLEPYKKSNPQGKWEDWVKSAFFDRVSLSSTGYHATPDIGYSFKTNSGNAFNYFTFGVACSVVEIDCLTGDHQVLRTDIVMDLGESLNPAIDIGQIEGGFMQGYGMFVMEQIIHSPDGVLLTRGPGAYKIPSFNDVPSQFNVCLLRGASNPRAVYSSKAVGEPPLFLAASVFFAIKNAIRSARQDAGASPNFHLDSPATAERIRLGCEDNFLKQVPELPEEGTYRPWGIQV